MPSSIAIGDNNSFDLHNDIEVRECDNDDNYPLALEGVTKGGHGVSISISETDYWILYEHFNKGDF